MTKCEYCGYDFEHNPTTCKVLIAEKKEEGPKIRFCLGGNRNRAKIPTIKANDILALADYLNKKR